MREISLTSLDPSSLRSEMYPRSRSTIPWSIGPTTLGLRPIAVRSLQTASGASGSCAHVKVSTSRTTSPSSQLLSSGRLGLARGSSRSSLKPSALARGPLIALDAALYRWGISPASLSRIAYRRSRASAASLGLARALSSRYAPTSSGMGTSSGHAVMHLPHAMQYSMSAATSSDMGSSGGAPSSSSLKRIALPRLVLDSRYADGTALVGHAALQNPHLMQSAATSAASPRSSRIPRASPGVAFPGSLSKTDRSPPLSSSSARAPGGRAAPP